MPISVYIAVEVKIFCCGIAQIIDGSPEFDVVGTTDNVATALRAVRAAPPQILLLDAGIMSAGSSLRDIAGAALATKIVGIGVGDDDASIGACADARVAAFVTRHESIDRLIEILLAAMRNEFMCSPRVGATLLRRLGREKRVAVPEPLAPDLTRRQFQILDLIASGQSNKEIAGVLGIELSTVKNHVHQILERLAVQRRGEAAAVWVRAQRGQAGQAASDPL